jgi:hypothetical protein
MVLIFVFRIKEKGVKFYILFSLDIHSQACICKVVETRVLTCFFW